MKDTVGAAPSITVEGLWQVFGADARAALVSEEATGAAFRRTGAAKAALRGRGPDPGGPECEFRSETRRDSSSSWACSGSGKSTLIRCISRLIEPTGGHVLIEWRGHSGRQPEAPDRDAPRSWAWCSSISACFPHMTVAENVAFPLKMQGQSAKRRRERAPEVIELVGLGRARRRLSRASCPAASASASALPARSPSTPISGFWTSPSRRSIP